MKTKKEYIQGIGFIEVKRWKSSKNIKLSFKPGHGFLLTYPYSSNKSSALKIIKIHRNWIDKIKEKYDNFEVKDLEIQEKKLLKVKLEKRLKELSKAHNLPYNKFFLRKMRSRWGSCSGKNNINLSIYLINLPEDLIDYVILHELCHTIEKNHSSSFWNLMEKILPGAKSLDKKLGNYFQKKE